MAVRVPTLGPGDIIPSKFLPTPPEVPDVTQMVESETVRTIAVSTAPPAPGTPADVLTVVIPGA